MAAWLNLNSLRLSPGSVPWDDPGTKNDPRTERNSVDGRVITNTIASPIRGEMQSNMTVRNDVPNHEVKESKIMGPKEILTSSFCAFKCFENFHDDFIAELYGYHLQNYSGRRQAQDPAGRILGQNRNSGNPEEVHSGYAFTKHWESMQEILNM